VFQLLRNKQQKRQHIFQSLLKANKRIVSSSRDLKFNLKNTKRYWKTCNKNNKLGKLLDFILGQYPQLLNFAGS